MDDKNVVIERIREKLKLWFMCLLREEKFLSNKEINKIYYCGKFLYLLMVN